jgi:hypothetical protein
LDVTGTPPAREAGGTARRWQVLTVSGNRITDIRGFGDRTEAAAGPTCLPEQPGDGDGPGYQMVDRAGGGWCRCIRGASYEHAYDLVRVHEEAGWTARLAPLTSRRAVFPRCGLSGRGFMLIGSVRSRYRPWDTGMLHGREKVDGFRVSCPMHA